MLYLLDTNALRDLMDENLRVVQRLSREAASNEIATSVIARGEVLFGIARLPVGKRRDALEQNFRRLFESVDVLAVPVIAADAYAKIKWSREEVGRRMDENDLWIAASALVLNATLVTRDNDFAGTEGLSVEDWNR